MKKQNVINLIKYHMEHNDSAFIDEAYSIVRDFDISGDSELASYLMSIISGSNDLFVPQAHEQNYKFLKKMNTSSTSLFLPDCIKDDVTNIIRVASHGVEINRFLFQGEPGTGKTETAKQIARIMQRNLLTVDFESILDSHLGETSKNIAKLFDEINHLQYDRNIILLDEIDAIALDRINSNDIREMGRASSSFIKEMDKLNPKILLIATTNLYKQFDKAILRRFDAIIDFNRYSLDDLLVVADYIISEYLKKGTSIRKDLRFLKKILYSAKTIPTAGELKRSLKLAIAFNSASSNYDYLRKLYLDFNNNVIDSIESLSKKGFTTREIEVLTNISKSQVSRKLKEDDNE